MNTICFTAAIQEHVSFPDFHPLVFPNPGNGQMNIQYVLPQTETAVLSNCDVCGKLMVEIKLPAGENTLVLNEQKLGDGIYFCKYSSWEKPIGATTKLVIVK